MARIASVFICSLLFPVVTSKVLGSLDLPSDDKLNVTKKDAPWEVKVMKRDGILSYWTDWYDRDDPTGKGDSERMLHLMQDNLNVCDGMTPDMAECRVKGHKTTFYYWSTDLMPDKLVPGYECSPLNGLACENSNQKDGQCEDYEIRFKCPTSYATSWLGWYDRDDPSGNGDSEQLKHFVKDGNYICNGKTPIQSKCRVKGSDTIFTRWTVDKAPDKLVPGYDCSPHGLVCENSDQKDKQCEDYEIQLRCPYSDGTYWTGWFDRDDPSGNGDSERLLHLRQDGHHICNGMTPLQAKCRKKFSSVFFCRYTLHRTPDKLAPGFECSPEYGLACENRDQKGGRKCADYEIMFLCPVSEIAKNRN